MRVRTRFRSSGAAEERDTGRLVERRLRLALGRRAQVIETVEIGIRQHEGGSADCSIRARLHDGHALRVEESAAALERAGERAIWRFEHHLARHLAAPPPDA